MVRIWSYFDQSWSYLTSGSTGFYVNIALEHCEVEQISPGLSLSSLCSLKGSCYALCPKERNWLNSPNYQNLLTEVLLGGWYLVCKLFYEGRKCFFLEMFFYFPPAALFFIIIFLVWHPWMSQLCKILKWIKLYSANELMIIEQYIPLFFLVEGFLLSLTLWNWIRSTSIIIVHIAGLSWSAY